MRDGKRSVHADCHVRGPRASGGRINLIENYVNEQVNNKWTTDQLIPELIVSKD